MIIDSPDDMFVFFEVIKQAQCQSVLDIGMFLQRIGCVARQAMHCRVPEKVHLTGVSVDEKIFPITKYIYNDYIPIDYIDDMAMLLEIEENFSYDLIMYMHVNEYLSGDMTQLWDWMIAHGKRIVADAADDAFVGYMTARLGCTPLQAGDSRYVMFDTDGAHTGAYVYAEVPSAIPAAKADIRPSGNGEDIRIYVAAHKKFDAPEDDVYIPLHVGCEGKEPLGYIGDNTGDNISTKNQNYCELTGIYWMWKNVNCDIIGLCHYRRYFRIGGRILGRQDVKMLMDTYDIVVGDSSVSASNCNVREHFSSRHNERDLERCREAIEALCPEYADAFDMTVECNLMSIGNMIICSKRIFDKYCEWLFPILKWVENRTDMTGYTDYQKRLYGFLSERLMRTWLFEQEYKIGEVQIGQTDV